MSSGTRYNPDAFRNMAGSLADETMARVARLGMSPRQQHLNWLWAFYCAMQYESRGTDWDGSRHEGQHEKEVISNAGFVPPGNYDVSGQMNELPLKFRRPTAPYHLVRVIVNRFTGLLFSKGHHPRLEVPGDDKTEDFAQGIAEAARLWPQMILARTYGGAMGSVALGFKFVGGSPRIEVHDPRWLRPTFENREELELSALEKRYMYPVESLNPDNGEWEDVWFWYRRVIDEQRDIVWPPVAVADGEEPDWAALECDCQIVDHGFGFCPVVWIQNLPVQDDIDGEPDCHGTYDMVEEIDGLLAQAGKGTKANCDPTLILITDEDLANLRKGSGNAIKLPAGGSAAYLEITGTGPMAAREMAEQYRKYVLEVTQTVLEHPDVAGRTATEIERLYSSMLDKGDILREQYGERGVKPLLEMMLKAARQLGKGRAVNGQVVKGAIVLPPKVVDGQTTQRELGDSEYVYTRWPAYFEPSITDAQAAATAASTALMGGLIDQEHATKFVAELFGVEDPGAVLDKIAEQRAAEEAMIASTLGAPAPPAAPGEGEAETPPTAPPPPTTPTVQ